MREKNRTVQKSTRMAQRMVTEQCEKARIINCNPVKSWENFKRRSIRTARAILRTRSSLM